MLRKITDPWQISQDEPQFDFENSSSSVNWINDKKPPNETWVKVLDHQDKTTKIAMAVYEMLQKLILANFGSSLLVG